MIPVPFSERQLAAFRRVYPDAHIRHHQDQTVLVWTTNKGKRIRCLAVTLAQEATWEKQVRLRKSDGLCITTTHKKSVLVQ